MLAVVAGGLYMSAQRLVFLNSSSRIQGFHVWESFIFILNGIVFLIIGLELPEIVAGLKTEGIPLTTAIGYGLLITGVLIGSRIISAYTAMLATFIFRPNVAMRFRREVRFITPLLLGWSGMRGVVSLAAALAIPVTLESGIEFPQRDLILFITFIVILVTLVLQGLTLPRFIQRSGAFDAIVLEETTEDARQQVRQGLKANAQQFLKNKLASDSEDQSSMRHLVKLWEEQVDATGDGWMTEKTRKVFLELLETQRQYLAELNKDPKIDEEIIRLAQYQIDLEEIRLKMS